MEENERESSNIGIEHVHLIISEFASTSFSKREKKSTVIYMRKKRVVSKETVVLRRWGSSIQKFWFYQRS